MYIYGWLFTSGVLFPHEIHRWSIAFIKTTVTTRQKRGQCLVDWPLNFLHGFCDITTSLTSLTMTHDTDESAYIGDFREAM